MRHLLTGSVLLLAACGANTSDMRNQMDTCGDATRPNAAIAACNHLLDHEALPSKTRAYVYYSRARAAMEKKDPKPTKSTRWHRYANGPTRHALHRAGRKTRS